MDDVDMDPREKRRLRRQHKRDEMFDEAMPEESPGDTVYVAYVMRESLHLAWTHYFSLQVSRLGALFISAEFEGSTHRACSHRGVAPRCRTTFISPISPINPCQEETFFTGKTEVGVEDAKARKDDCQGCCQDRSGAAGQSNTSSTPRIALTIP